MTGGPLISAASRVAAVIGSPVRHSLSPALHNAGFADTGADWAYVAFEVAPGCAAEALAAMRTLGLGGLSVTMPHKEAVADLVDEVDAAAAALHSVNTVVPGADGRLHGYSTDGDGFLASLHEAEVSLDGAAVCVLGAGGAARAIVDALGRSPASEIVVVNRSPSRGADAVSLGHGRAVLGEMADVAHADVVVNATSVGMGTEELPLDATLLRRGQVVADIVYHPRRTALLRAAADAGATTVDGLGMLVHQAVLQQQLFTGRAPAAGPMRAAAERELATRGQ